MGGLWVLWLVRAYRSKIVQPAISYISCLLSPFFLWSYMDVMISLFFFYMFSSWDLRVGSQSLCCSSTYTYSCSHNSSVQLLSYCFPLSTEWWYTTISEKKDKGFRIVLITPCSWIEKNVSTSSDVELEKRRKLVIENGRTLKGFILDLGSPSKFKKVLCGLLKSKDKKTPHKPNKVHECSKTPNLNFRRAKSKKLRQSPIKFIKLKK